MLKADIASRPASRQPNSFIFPAARTIAILAASINAYLTLRYAQSLWPSDTIVSTAIVVVWEASLVCFAAAGLYFFRQSAYLRSLAFVLITGVQMAGSAYASATSFDGQAVTEDQTALALARDHRATLAHIESIQAQIKRTLGPKTLANLRAEQVRALAMRHSQEERHEVLGRGEALLDASSGAGRAVSLAGAVTHADGNTALSPEAHRRVAIMLQFITVAALIIGASGQSDIFDERAARGDLQRAARRDLPHLPHDDSSGPSPTDAAQPIAVRAQSPAPVAEDGAPDLYHRIRADIAADIVGPSNRAIQRQFGLGWRPAQKMLERMVGEGVITRGTRSYQRVS